MLCFRLELKDRTPWLSLTTGASTWIDALLLQRLVLDGEDDNRSLLDLLNADVSEDRVQGQLGPLTLTRTFRQVDGGVEERITLENRSEAPVALTAGLFGVQQLVTDAAGSIDAAHADDHWVAIPFRRSPWETKVQDWDTGALIAEPGRERRHDTEQEISYADGWQHLAEGFAWEHGDACLGVFSGNDDQVQFGALAALPDTDGTVIALGASLPGLGEAGAPTTLAPGESLSCGTVRYVALTGNHMQAMHAYRDWLDARGYRFPADYNPPVQWNELYDNPEWTVTPGFPVEVEHCQDRATRQALYTLASMREEAVKAKAHGCEAIYLDPGWDTVFGSLLWDEERLGSLADFVREMRDAYGLRVCLHCPMAPWSSWVSADSADTWPTEARRPLADLQVGRAARLCYASGAYLDAATERLLALCDQGVCFIMLDGTFWVGACSSPDHGHGVPSSFGEHAAASYELCRRIKASYPEVLIELHDPLSGGARARWMPTYFGYDPGGGFDENWGFELMWDPFEDLSSGRARALYYYAQSCNVPIYLHIDLRMDNAHATAFWWYASTCRHLGFGGTHEDPNVVTMHQHAAHRYRRLERFFKVGEFHGVTEEVHLHVLPDENAVVVNLFNLGDTPCTVEATYPLAELGIDLTCWYTTTHPNVMLDAHRGELLLGGKLPPWGNRVIELRAVSQEVRP